jgi:hypothetical protein
MPIVDSDIQFRASADMPWDDADPAGGAIDLTTKVAFTQFSAAARPEIVSDGADTRDVTIVGRLASGVEVTETKALNGTTPVLFDATYERILSVTADAASATRTISVHQGASGTVRVTLEGDNVLTDVVILFGWAKAEASGGSTKVYYEKIFAKNAHATLALLEAVAVLTADPSAKIELGVDPTKDSSLGVADRLTAPAGVTFGDDDVEAAIEDNELLAGEAIGIWLELTLAAGTAPAKTTATVALRGSSI